MSDLVRVIEAAYSLDEPDEAAWLARLAEVMRAELRLEHGLVAYTFHVAADGWITPSSITLAAADPELASDLLNPGAFPPEDAASVIETHTTAGLSLATRIGSRGIGIRTGPGRAYFERVLGSRGFVDALTINATDPTRNGCMFFVPVRERPSIGPRAANRYAKLCAHIAAGLRLRRGLAGEREAEIAADGKIEGATSAAATKSARIALREAVRAVDRARGKLRRDDPEEALAIWRGLVSGRWSLVDRFDADGRRYFVARPNAPDAPDPRALTARERQIAGFIAMGQSNKLIAYELGISPSTVGVIAARAAKKLGARSRTHLAAMFLPRRQG